MSDPKQLGRPRKPEGEARDVRLDVLVRQGEARDLRKGAKEARKSLSAYLWDRIFKPQTPR